MSVSDGGGCCYCYCYYFYISVFAEKALGKARKKMPLTPVCIIFVFLPSPTHWYRQVFLIPFLTWFEIVPFLAHVAVNQSAYTSTHMFPLHSCGWLLMCDVQICWNCALKFHVLLFHLLGTDYEVRGRSYEGGAWNFPDLRTQRVLFNCIWRGFESWGVLSLFGSLWVRNWFVNWIGTMV